MSIKGKLNKLFILIKNLFNDDFYLAKDVPTIEEIKHNNWIDYIVELADKPGYRILELGSREVVASSLRNKFKNAEYIGFDFYPGANVDVVGDAHKLSTYFDQKFDLIFSHAVFEHLAMPWIVAEEIAKLLKIGGYIFCETHYSYSSHERPWHFFQFSENALKILFNEKMGIKCLKAGCSNPIVARFSRYAFKPLRYRLIQNMYSHSEFLGQKIAEKTDFSWYNCSLKDVVGETKYPAPKNN